MHRRLLHILKYVFYYEVNVTSLYNRNFNNPAIILFRRLCVLHSFVSKSDGDYDRKLLSYYLYVITQSSSPATEKIKGEY